MKTIKPITKESQCSYEYYSKEEKRLTTCKNLAIYLYGNKPLCSACGKLVVSYDLSCRKLNKDGKIVLKLDDVLN